MSYHTEDQDETEILVKESAHILVSKAIFWQACTSTLLFLNSLGKCPYVEEWITNI